MRRLTGTISPGRVKRLEEFGGACKFPSSDCNLAPERSASQDRARRREQPRTVQPRWQGRYPLARVFQPDPDAYSYSGGLNRTTQGLLEFVEMFKAPSKCCTPCSPRRRKEIMSVREHRWPPTRALSRPLERGRMADLQEQQEQRGIYRSNFRDKGTVLLAWHRRAQDL